MEPPGGYGLGLGGVLLMWLVVSVSSTRSAAGSVASKLGVPRGGCGFCEKV